MNAVVEGLNGLVKNMSDENFVNQLVLDLTKEYQLDENDFEHFRWGLIFGIQHSLGVLKKSLDKLESEG